MRRPLRVISATIFASTASVAFAQPATQPSQVAPVAPPPGYTPVRYNEDYSYLKDKPGNDLFDPIKYVPLGADGFYASFGGQARVRYEHWSNENFGAVSNDWGYALQRYFLHADVHLGPTFRVFAQGKSSLVDDGRDVPPNNRPLDADELDIQQLFVDAKLSLGDKDGVTLRFGRQDLIYGSQRLISPLDWANARRTFEGAKVSTQLGAQTIDAFLVRPVNVEEDELNDGNGNVAFGGVYDTIGLPKVFEGAQTKLDVYVLGLWTSGGAVDSDTYTVGARFFTQPKPFDLDVELDYQFGTRNGDRISAYSIATEAGYTLPDVTFGPRVYLGFDYASGDEDPTDNDYNTFNQLFPLGHAYLGYIDAIGRQNIMDVHPGVELALMKDARYVKKLSLRTDYHVFWRASDDDGLYNAGGAQYRTGGGSGANYVGSELDLLMTWQIDRHAQFYVGYSHFFPGEFVEDTGPSDDVDFVYAAFQYTF